MYEADDVSEETEEIILRRAQDGVDRARHSLAGSKIRSETSLKITIPREDMTKKEGELRKRLEVVKARSTSEADLKKKQLGMEKQLLTGDCSAFHVDSSTYPLFTGRNCSSCEVCVGVQSCAKSCLTFYAHRIVLG